MDTTAPPQNLRIPRPGLFLTTARRGNALQSTRVGLSMALNKSKVWTEEEDRKLLELRQAGRAPISVAATLKRTRGAVNARLSFLIRETQHRAPSPAYTR